MYSKKYNELQHNVKPVGANSSFISWFVILTFIFSMLLVYFDSSTYHHVTYFANNSVFGVTYNVTTSIDYVNERISVPTVANQHALDSNVTPSVGFVKNERNFTPTVVNQQAADLDECVGKYIFVQHLPSQFNYDLLKNCSSLNPWNNMCKDLVNSGLGPWLNDSDQKVFPDSGWFTTNQFSLEVIFHNRMKQYGCLTNDSSKATAVFVPYYARLDVGRYLWNNDVKVRDGGAIELVEYLKGKPEWKKMYGRDHFLVAGRITWDFRREDDEASHWGNSMFVLPEVKNMTSLVIESSPWNNTDFAIPYPTYFHPSSDNEVYSWQERMRKQSRPYLFSFAGAPRPQFQDSVRNEIIDQCTASEHCKFIKCEVVSRNCAKPRNLMQLFQRSVFCLQPPGDSYTRRSAFDAILAGCIPVFFHPASAYVQYLWHLPKNYTSYSVFIPMEDVKKGIVSIEKRLLEIPKEEAAAMRDEAIRLIPRLVYANPESKLETTEDAFDLSVKEVLNRIEKIRMTMNEGMNSTYESFPEELSWKYNFFGAMENHEWDRYFERK